MTNTASAALPLSPAVPLPCIVCGRALDPIFPEHMNDDDYVQPADAISLTGHGIYGSKVFDPMDGSYVSVNICDDCLAPALASGRAVIEVTVHTSHVRRVSPLTP